jgi:hypothetical protein
VASALCSIIGFEPLKFMNVHILNM